MRTKPRGKAIASSRQIERKESRINAPLLPDLITRYLSWRERSVSPNTLLRLKCSLKAAAARLPGDIRSIDAAVIENYVTTRRVAGLRDASIRNELNAVSSLCRYAVRHKWLLANPVQGIDRPSDRESARFAVITPEEETAYFAACPEGELRDLARWILDSGARPSEILSLTAQDIDLAANRFRIEHGKTAAARRKLLLTPEVRKIAEKRISNGRLFSKSLVELDHEHKKVLASCGLDFVLYSLRHTFLTRLASRGCPLATLAAIAGHASLRMITRYVHPQQTEIERWMTSQPVRSEQNESPKKQPQDAVWS